MFEELLTSRSRAKIIEFLMGSPDKEYYLREISRQLSLNPRSTHIELKRLNKMGLLKSRRSGNSLYFQADPDFLFYDEILSIVRKSGERAVH